MLAAPDEVGGGMAFITAPPAPFVPPEVQGHPVVAIVVSYAGDVDGRRAGARAVAGFGPPAIDLVEPMPYLALQGLIEAGNPHGMHNYWTADFYGSLPDEAIDVLVAGATNPVSPLTQILVVPGGGAISPRGRGRDGVRRASRRVEHPLPVDVARSRRLARRTSSTRGTCPAR